MYPQLTQSKFRIDEKRPMTKDGEEKKPWSKFLFQQQKRDIFKEFNYRNCSAFKIQNFFVNYLPGIQRIKDDESKNGEEICNSIKEIINRNFHTIDNLVLQIKELLDENDKLLGKIEKKIA